MAISVYFSLTYSKTEIKKRKLESSEVSVRIEVEYTKDTLPMPLAKRLGKEVVNIKGVTPLRVEPKNWKSSRIRATAPDAWDKNAKLEGWAKKAKAVHGHACKTGEWPDKDTFLGEILGEETVEQTPLFDPSRRDFFADWAAWVRYLRHKNTGSAFCKHAELVGKRVQDFGTATGYAIDYHTINRTFGAAFLDYMMELPGGKYGTLNVSKNTANKSLSKVRQFLNHAIAEGWTSAAFYKQLKPRFTKNAFPTTLDDSEITRLLAVRLSGRQRGALVTRDWFVFATQTGLRHSDWVWEKFELVDVPGGKNIRLVQQKTDGDLEVPLSTLALQILERNGWRMPERYSCAGSEKHLSILSKEAGIGKHLTTHTARRTFATNQVKVGVPTYTIMQITGHKTERDFWRYVGITVQFSADALRKANPRMFAQTG